MQQSWRYYIFLLMHPVQLRRQVHNNNEPNAAMCCLPGVVCTFSTAELSVLASVGQPSDQALSSSTQTNPEQ